MLYRIEVALEYTSTYGDMDEAFYNRLIDHYKESLKYIFDHQMESKFDHDCFSLKNDADEIGWGVSEILDQIYYAYYYDLI